MIQNHMSKNNKKIPFDRKGRGCIVMHKNGYSCALQYTSNTCQITLIK